MSRSIGHTSSNNPDFAELVDVYMDARGLTHRELAERLGVDGSTVHRWRQGTAKPLSLKKILDLANALELQTDAERRALIQAAGFLIDLPQGGSEMLKDYPPGLAERLNKFPEVSPRQED